MPGLFNSLEGASCSYLSTELHRRGIPPSIVPTSCIQEIVRERLNIAHLTMKYTTPRGAYGSRQDIRQLMALSLDNDADRIAELLTGTTTDVRHDSLSTDAREKLTGLLARHGVAIRTQNV
jgi:hypothetical protein